MRKAWRVAVGIALAGWVALRFAALWTVATAKDEQDALIFAPVVLLGVFILPIAYVTFTTPKPDPPGA